MPYINVNTPLKISEEAKEKLARELIAAYSQIMQTQLWRPNVGIIEMGKENLIHLADDVLEPIVMVLVEYRRGRPHELRLQLARRIAKACHQILSFPEKNVLIEFTPHDGNEIYRNGEWVAEWSPSEATSH
jgi:phenylpyruvate tautomerase PptA (4-oxalocrotonate tautomerase family)